MQALSHLALFSDSFFDMHLWPWLIKKLSWVPLRSIFQTDPPNLRGEWDVYWEAKSSSFPSDIENKKTARVYQLDGYCYADYAAGDQRYCRIGKIEGSYLTGIWRNIKSVYGYRGSFQLRIVDQSNLKGR